MAIPLGRPLPSASCDRPERRREGPPGIRDTQGCPPLLLGLAPGGVFPAAAVADGAVRSYRTVSPLPPARSCRDRPAVYFLWHYPWGRPRRGLPGTVPPWSPDFPLSAPRGERPSDRLAQQHLGARSEPVKARRLNCDRREKALGHNSDMGFYGLDPVSGARADRDCAARVRFYNCCRPTSTC